MEICEVETTCCNTSSELTTEDRINNLRRYRESLANEVREVDEEITELEREC
ncbi:MAG: hypothetical protein PHF67_01380 [Candidatus Nanoarchaeia archaeon]|nr:hypothetical protein [Candidatus Nanoarchaeia archaeon]